MGRADHDDDEPVTKGGRRPARLLVSPPTQLDQHLDGISLVGLGQVRSVSLTATQRASARSDATSFFLRRSSRGRVAQDRFALVYRDLVNKAAGVRLAAAVLCTDDQLDGCTVQLGAQAVVSTGEILPLLVFPTGDFQLTGFRGDKGRGRCTA